MRVIKGNKPEKNNNMFLDMDLETKIAECETIAELNALESLYILNNVESGYSKGEWS